VKLEAVRMIGTQVESAQLEGGDVLDIEDENKIILENVDINSDWNIMITLK